MELYNTGKRSFFLNLMPKLNQIIKITGFKGHPEKTTCSALAVKPKLMAVNSAHKKIATLEHKLAVNLFNNKHHNFVVTGKFDSGIFGLLTTTNLRTKLDSNFQDQSISDLCKDNNIVLIDDNKEEFKIYFAFVFLQDQILYDNLSLTIADFERYPPEQQEATINWLNENSNKIVGVRYYNEAGMGQIIYLPLREIYQLGNVKVNSSYDNFNKESLDNTIASLNELPKTEGLNLVSTDYYRSALQNTELIVPSFIDEELTLKNSKQKISKLEILDKKSPFDSE